MRAPVRLAVGLVPAAVAAATLAALALVGGGGATAPPAARAGHLSQVVVQLTARPSDPTGVRREQARFAAALREAVPTARLRWRYRLTLNGFSVVVPTGAVAELRRLPGVRTVFPPATYRVARATGPGQIGAPALWGPNLERAGDGLKIAIIDDGVDQTHPYFAPDGFTMPPGFPKGNAAYTTAKVIVARAFPPPGSTWKHAGRPFDPEHSDHGTHVAGIAAGNAGTRASGGQILSGVAPHAYIGNYKALTTPTAAGVGLNGNAPELVAAIEAAVADGMDVINLSIGEAEIEPSRDVVALALDAAAAAGVIPVVAAGNDYDTFGRGSVASPGNAARAITVGAVTNDNPGIRPTIVSFSSAGPTPISLRLKPDVAAPGSSIMSATPGGWRSLSGTSMASPHVAGAVALLRQGHPTWSVAQIKAALIASSDPVSSGDGLAPPTRVGGGIVDLVAADAPLVFAEPASLSFGFLAPEETREQTVVLSDAGGGTGAWAARVEVLGQAAGAIVAVPAEVAVPGSFAVSVSAAGAREEEFSGHVVLERAGVQRRIPFWGRVASPKLDDAQAEPLTKPGEYSGNTRMGARLVERYLYPEVQPGGEITTALRGPELVFRVSLKGPVANFGVVVLTRAAKTRVEPRVVEAGNELRLTGYPGLPVNLNPYLSDYGEPTLSAGAIKPLPGSYDVVFDSANAAGAGAFTFRFWVNDVAPPRARIVSRKVRAGSPLVLEVGDAGSGIDPSSISVEVDRSARGYAIGRGQIRVSTLGLKPGRHALTVQLSDHQETRNMENVGRILPNTRIVRTTFVVSATPKPR